MPELAVDAVEDVVCGRHHSTILCSSGRLFTWGASSYGRLGLDHCPRVVPEPRAIPFFESRPVHAIATGDFHTLALTKDWVGY
jgi:alpha-tubulin suppressor-like RCC1 family protein